MGLAGALSLGVGAMIGAGIFALLGDAVQIGGTAVWIAFFVAGGVVAFSAYSYAALGRRFPSAGGPVEFLIQGLGGGPLTGTVNLVLWLANIAVLALVAKGLGGYVAALWGDPNAQDLQQAFAIGSILLFAAVNSFGAKLVARAELVIVIIKLVVLAVFCVGALARLDVASVAPATWPSWGQIMSCAGFVFVAYTGFGFITNAAEEMDDPAVTLPRALYGSVAIVIVVYTAVSLGLVGTMSLPEIDRTKEYALAVAAEPFLGQIGFQVIGVAAVISASSAINATLFGAANISYTIARHGELPEFFERKMWRGIPDGLVVTAGLTVMAITWLDLAAVASVASLAFLTTYVFVHIAHLRVLDQTGARPILVVVALVTSLLALGTLVVHVAGAQPISLVVFVASLVAALAFESSLRSARKLSSTMFAKIRGRHGGPGTN